MSSLSPSVWIIVLGWNGCQDTVDCLYSLQHLDYPKCNVLFVDNGSTDGTVSAVRAQFPRVRILENGKNLGFAQGNNVGILHALQEGADFVFLVNNDALVELDCVQRLCDVANAHSEIGILCPTIVSYTNPTKTYVGGRMYWRIATGDEIERSPAGLPECIDVDYAPGCALLIKANVIRKIGLLDPAFFAYFEDADWSIRARRAGYRVVAVPHARVTHKGTMDNTAPKSPLATYLFWRNRFLFYRKHGHWYHLGSFAKDMTRKPLERYHALMRENAREQAHAVLDGCWAGLTGEYGSTQIQAPQWFTRFVENHLITLLWLTGWLYFFDYQKAKRKQSAV